MKKSFKHIGEAMLKIRKEAGLTQKEMAKIAGVHSQFISNLERHICDLPPKAFQRLHKKLRISREVIKLAIVMDQAIEREGILKMKFGK